MNKHTHALFKYLSLYLSSSIDIASSLRLTKMRLGHARTRRLVDMVMYSLESGRSIVDSFEVLRSEKVIDSVVWSMIVSSCNGGTFHFACIVITEYIKKQVAVRHSFISSLAYPIGVLMSACGMVLFLITVIFPKILPLFSSMNIPLPMSTRFIIQSSFVIHTYFVSLLILFFVGALTVYFLFKKNNIWKVRIENAFIMNRLVRGFFLPREYYRLSLSLYSLMNSGVSLVDALSISCEASLFATLRDAGRQIHDDVEHGKKLSDAITFQPIFEHEWAHMSAVGEMTGSLPIVFRDLSLFYEKICAERTELLARWSEPVALAGSAVIILIVALSVIQPMYSIIQFAHPV